MTGNTVPYPYPNMLNSPLAWRKWALYLEMSDRRTAKHTEREDSEFTLEQIEDSFEQGIYTLESILRFDKTLNRLNAYLLFNNVLCPFMICSDPKFGQLALVKLKNHQPLHEAAQFAKREQVQKLLARLWQAYVKKPTQGKLRLIGI